MGPTPTSKTMKITFFFIITGNILAAGHLLRDVFFPMKDDNIEWDTVASPGLPCRHYFVGESLQADSVR